MPSKVRCVTCQKLFGYALQGQCTFICTTCTCEQSNLNITEKGNAFSYGKGMIPKLDPKSV